MVFVLRYFGNRRNSFQARCHARRRLPVPARCLANIQVDYTAGLDPIPDDLQMAAALAVGNLFNQPDLTKQREKIGASYYYIGRPGELAFTPEIKAILNLYRDQLT